MPSVAVAHRQVFADNCTNLERKLITEGSISNGHNMALNLTREAQAGIYFKFQARATQKNQSCKMTFFWWWWGCQGFTVVEVCLDLWLVCL